MKALFVAKNEKDHGARPWHIVLWCRFAELSYNFCIVHKLVNSSITARNRIAGRPKLPANPLISVVDDDPSMSRMLARIIAAAGFDVESFGSAEAFLQSGRFDDSACLILDV